MESIRIGSRALLVVFVASVCVTASDVGSVGRVERDVLSEEVRLQEHTSELMTQILTAVSSKQGGAHDNTLFGQLCDLVNDAEKAVLGLTNTEEKDAEFHVARLRSELDETNVNITGVRAEHNVTVRELSMLISQHSPIPVQLADAKTREAELQRQKKLLTAECSQDLDGQHVRVASIKTDMQVLDQTIDHLAKLAKIGAPSAAASSFLETDSSAVADATAPRCDRATLARKAAGPVVQCENGITVPVTGRSGTISTLPPGEGMSYKQSRTCTFKIEAVDGDVLDKAELEFFALDAADGEDYVTVYDGPVANDDHVLATFSGRSLPPVVRSRQFSSLTVTFKDTAGKTASPGFMANYRILKIPLDKSSSLNECSEFNGIPIVLTGKSGYISEDARPEYASAVQRNAGTAYQSPRNCKWLVQAQPGQRVRLHFTYLETLASDQVVVYDGPGEISGEALRESGVKTPSDVESTGSALFVTYNANYAVSGKGFHLSWCLLGETCPELDLPSLPPPAPVAVAPVVEQHNESAPVVQSPPAIDALVPAVQPPPYPNVQAEEEDEAAMTRLMANLIELEEGEREGEEKKIVKEQNLEANVVPADGLSTIALVSVAASGMTDECREEELDAVSLEGIGVDTDPVKMLLEKLKFELHRSLNYEHDTTNLTNRHCAHEVHSIEKNMEDMQLEILKLSKGLSEMDAKIAELQTKNSTLHVKLHSLREWAADLAQQIRARKAQVSSRSESQNSQLKTLGSMREIITQLGQHTCLRADVEWTFAETPGQLCVGELLDVSLQTDDVQSCKVSCSDALNCAGFSFLKGQGCKLYSSLTSSVGCPDGLPSTCSCFRVLK